MITYVYLIKANGLYKIGMCADPRERLRQLAKKYGHTQYLWLIATNCQRQGQCLEQAIHNLFTAQHLGREWFNLTSTDIEKFKTIQPGDLVDINFVFTHLSPATP